MKRVAKGSLVIFFGLYLLLLTKFIVLKYYPVADVIVHLQNFRFHHIKQGWDMADFVPLRTTIDYLFFVDIPVEVKVKKMGEYIFAFAPLGIMLPLLSQRFQRFRNVLLVSVLIGVVFELFQGIFTFGVFLVDDILLYVLGSALGLLFVKVVTRRGKPHSTKKIRLEYKEKLACERKKNYRAFL